MAKILITGDIHGTQDIGSLQDYFFLYGNQFTKDDYLIICGDVAVCGFSAFDSRQTREFLSDLPVTVLFCDGNHENFEELNAYPVEEWNGGKIHRIASDIIHLMRGQVYQLDRYTFFVFGGAYSVDRDSRIKGYTWFEEELPSEDEYEEEWKNLEKANFQVDYVITHTAPEEVVAELGFGSYEEAEEQTREFQRYADELDFKHWFFGHFHLDEDVEEQYHCVMDRIMDLVNYD